jgi:hypothetical protein
MAEAVRNYTVLCSLIISIVVPTGLIPYTMKKELYATLLWKGAIGSNERIC